MLSADNKKLLHDLRNSAYGRALKELLDDKYAILGDITTIENDNNLMVETISRKKALLILKEIFSFLEEKKNPELNKNQYI